MQKTLITAICFFQIFAIHCSATLITFIPSLTYKLFVVIVSSISFFVTVSAFYKKPKTRLPIFIIAVFGLLLIMAYSFTSSHYFQFSSKYESFFMVLYGQTLPAMIIAAIVSQETEIQENIKRYTPIIAVIFTIIAFVAAFFPSSATSGGFTDNENGLNYQSTSYMAAYAAGLNYYYILLSKSIKWAAPFSKDLFRKLIPCLVIVNFLTILIAGGRGGLVTFVFLTCSAFFIKLHTTKFSLLKSARFYMGIFVIILVGCLCFYFAQNSSIETSGFSRILDFVQEHDTNGRNELREIALTRFDDAPIFGHGLGSVFFEVGEYSHNCVTDLLVETGMVGCTIAITIFMIVVIRLLKTSFKNHTEVVWLIFLFDGFMMSLFSGYYLATSPVIWIISFVFCRNYFTK